MGYWQSCLTTWSHPLLQTCQITYYHLTIILSQSYVAWVHCLLWLHNIKLVLHWNAPKRRLDYPKSSFGPIKYWLQRFTLKPFSVWSNYNRLLTKFIDILLNDFRSITNLKGFVWLVDRGHLFTGRSFSAWSLANRKLWQKQRERYENNICWSTPTELSKDSLQVVLCVHVRVVKTRAMSRQTLDADYLALSVTAVLLQPAVWTQSYPNRTAVPIFQVNPMDHDFAQNNSGFQHKWWHLPFSASEILGYYRANDEVQIQKHLTKPKNPHIMAFSSSVAG